MTADGGMMLIFRLGGIGFVLSVENLIEVRDTVRGWVDGSQSDSGHGVEGTIPHRGQSIPLRNLATRLALSPSATPNDVLHLLVLVGADGPWCIAVDHVEGVFSSAGHEPQTIPLLPFVEESWPFVHYLVWHEEPLLVVDPLDLEWRWREG